ncbi:MAG: DUF2796 domain-containing protein [Leptothrix sp. (in: b-proteobacteria)]
MLRVRCIELICSKRKSMKTTMTRHHRFHSLLALLLAGLALTPAVSVAEGAHVHGQVRLDIALDGPTLTLQMESPLDSVLGFEHRPQTAAQKQAVVQMKTNLEAATKLFRPDAAAQCAVSKASLESALFEPEVASTAAVKSEVHMDLDASYEFKCAHPELLKTLQIGLFEGFTRMQKIDVQVAGAKGQRKFTLKRPQSSITLAP